MVSVGFRIRYLVDVSGVLQYSGLPLDRERTLRAFIDALADKSLLVQGQAAQGLSFAGRPTDPVAATTLVETLSKEITGERIASERGTAIGDRVDLSLVVKISDALAILGKPAHLPTLRKIREHQDVSPNARQALDKAIEQIELRASEEEDATKASGTSETKSP